MVQKAKRILTHAVCGITPASSNKEKSPAPFGGESEQDEGKNRFFVKRTRQGGG